MRSIFILLLFAYYIPSCAQEEFILGDVFNNYLKDCISLSNGNILALGETQSVFSKDRDLLLIASTPDGKEVKRKTIGGYDDDYAKEVFEAPSGRYIVSGNSRTMGEKKEITKEKFWIKGIHPFTLEEEWELVLAQNTGQKEISNIIFDPQRNVFGVLVYSEGNVHMIWFDERGSMLDNKAIPDFPSLKVESLFLDMRNNKYFITGLGALYEGRKFPFAVQLSQDLYKERSTTLPDYHITHLGNVRFIDDRIYFVGTQFDKRSREDIFILSLPADLYKDDIQYSTFTERGQDSGMDVVKYKESIWVCGRSTSHQRGATKGNFLILKFDQANHTFNHPYYFGNAYEETPAKWMITDKGLYLVGQRDDGSIFEQDYNYYINHIDQRESGKNPSGDMTGVTNSCKLQLKTPEIYCRTDQRESTIKASVIGQELEIHHVTLHINEGHLFEFSPQLRYLGQGTIDYPLAYMGSQKTAATSYNYTLSLVTENGQTLCTEQGKIIVSPQKMATFAVELLDQEKAYKGKSNQLTFKITPSTTCTETTLNLFSDDNVVFDNRTWNFDRFTEGNSVIVKVNTTIPFEYHNATLPLQFFFSCKECQKEKQVLTIEVPLDNAVWNKNEQTDLRDSWLTIEWLTDYPDTIYSISQTFSLSAIALSSHPLSEDHFYIAHNKVESNLTGMKFDEKKLQRGKIQKANKLNLGFDVPLSEGINEIFLKYQDGESLYTTEKIYVDYQLEDKPKLYILSVGIPDLSSNGLRYTSKDAHDFAALFGSQRNKLFGEVNVELLDQSDNTTSIDITNSLAEYSRLNNLNKMKPQDLLILFVSSHGIYEDNDFYLQCTGYRKNNKQKTAINFETDVMERLEDLNCNSVVFLDACKSGQIHHEFSGRKSDLSGYSYSTAINKLTHSKKGVMALTSSSADEYSYEDEEWGNGAFTKGIKDILLDPKLCSQLDVDQDHALSLNELYDHLQSRVSKMVKKVKKSDQNPSLILTEKSMGDLPFFAY